jgi:hypothetical protein
MSPARIYADLADEVVLDNGRVRVHKLIVPPGQATGRPLHPEHCLQVFIRGGVLRSGSSGRSVHWKDGRVAWHSRAAAEDTGCVNAGTTAIEMIWVALKPAAASATTSAAPKYAYLDYPLIPGEDLLENDFVIVQRFLVAAGQWEGVHAHHPDMLYIHIKGGQWGARSYSEPEHPYDHAALDGEVGWMPTIDISEGHESGNIGKEPIDLIWVTLKQ